MDPTLLALPHCSSPLAVILKPHGINPYNGRRPPHTIGAIAEKLCPHHLTAFCFWEGRKVLLCGARVLSPHTGQNISPAVLDGSRAPEEKPQDCNTLPPGFLPTAGWQWG